MVLLESLNTIVYFFLALSALLPKRRRILFILISFEMIILNVFILGRMTINFTTFVFVLVTGVISRVLGLLVLLSALRFFGNDRRIL
jgi:hypothetical protein